MVFSPIPAYLDPSNWHQQQNHQIIGTTTAASQNQNPLFPPPPPPPQPPHGGAPGSGSIRPGSMSERARMANVPMPETAQKCPRCESTNTKFCYFNNYSLTQPRHFCKTCRRYWTRGGALRSVPVGGGCRRNKRSSSKSSSKSSPTTSNNSTGTISANNNNNNNNIGHVAPPQFPPLRFVSPLGLSDNNFTGDMGLSGNSYSGVTSTDQMNFHGGNLLFSGMEQWRPMQQQHFPFLGGFETTSSQMGTGGYQFNQGGDQLGFLGGDIRVPKYTSSLLSQMSSVKMEENDRELSLSRQLLGSGLQQGNGNGNGNENQWNINSNAAAAWTELTGFSSSSTSVDHLQKS